MSEKYKIRDQDKIYFVTFSVVKWIDVFTRPVYKEIIIENLKYCQEHKGLEIYAWCLMSNHIHLIVGRNGQEKIQNIVRDFKKYTSVKLIKAIKENPQESRREWLLWMFRKLAEKSNKHQKYCFWQNEYHPIELSDAKMMQQKLDYIHNNPLEEQIVNNPEDYRYSSAIDYSGGKGLIDIKFIE
ncbi:REP-associated tyrosine transposase [Ekhidna sp.]|uniref:REP-associated tyrosine transposase n=1 Tax=Ekhidna sp. TaxID=2608089 RepID=UPI003C7E0F09